MRLRTRLLVAMLLCALLPVVGVGLFARPVVLHAVERALDVANEPGGPRQTEALAAPATAASGAPSATPNSSITSTDARAQARARALAETTDDLRSLVVLLAVFSLSTAVLLALLLAPALTRPIALVADAADRIAGGSRWMRLDTNARTDEAGRLVRAFNRMSRELAGAERRLRRAERIAAWRDIARQMAHEIKNPLTPVQMAVEMLRKARERDLPDFDELFDEQTKIVLEEVARLRRLVEDFSRFARAPKPSFADVSIADVVEHVVTLHAASTEGVELTGEAEADLPSVRADREQLAQVLTNLVSNALFAVADRVRAAPEKGPGAVHVSARRVASTTGEGPRVAIAVDDNGPGVDPTIRDRLFEPYATTKQGRGGTGLGLAVVYRIVHDHGGTVSVETSQDGTRFEVVLPVRGPAYGERERTVERTLDTLREPTLEPG